SGFSNRMYLYFNSYKQLKDRSLYIGASVNQYVNAVGSRVSFDPESGRRDIQYLNIDESNYSANVYGGYRRPLWKKIALSLNIGADVSYNNSYNFLSLANRESQLNNNEN